MGYDQLDRRLAAIAVVDVVGYSRMMEVDETGTHARLRILRSDVIDPFTKKFNGRIFKNTGDGVLCEFKSAVDAVRCMTEIQYKLAEPNTEWRNDQRLLLRIGISLGDVIVDGDDLFGNGVNIAARMEKLADPGSICVSGNVFENISGVIDANFKNLGPQTVKNIERPIPAYLLKLDASLSMGKDHPMSKNVVSHPEKPSIAVLPFQNMSGDSEQEYFADGMAEDIITSLSHYRSLFVIARNSTFAYKGQSIDLRQVSRELEVRYILEGSVRKGGSRIRVTAQLIEGNSGSHIWAERYDRELEDIFTLQDEITENIVSAIGPEIDQVERERAKRLPPDNLDVWELYQRGLWHLYRFNKEDNSEAQKLFRNAINLASNFSPALSGLTHAMYYAYMHGYVENRGELLLEAFQLGRAAIAADERDADAHFAIGRILYLRRDLKASKAEFEAAIFQNPNFAHAYLGLGAALVFDGEFSLGIENCDHALRLSPNDPTHWIFLTVKGMGLICTGVYDLATQVLGEATRQPTAAWTAYLLLTSALGYTGDFAQARNAMETTLRIRPDLNNDHLREIFPFSLPEHLDIIIKGLGISGLENNIASSKD